jgi:hypothetical protein
MAFDVQVKAPEAKAVEIDIEYSGDAFTGDVIHVVEQYVNSLGIGGRFAQKDLYDLYKSLKLSTIEIVSPERDVQPLEREIIVISSMAVTKAA